MKRTILAIAIPALLAAGAVHAAEVYNKDGNKVDLYGKIVGLNYINVGNKEAKGMDGQNDQSYARFGINGQTQISDQLTGYGRFERNMKPGKNGDSDETRYAYAGLKFGNWGSVDYGRNDGVATSVLSYAAVYPEWGGDVKTTDRYMTSRTDGVLTYRNSDLFGVVPGLNIALQYQDENDNNREGYGLSAEYAILDTGVTVGATYANSLTGERDAALGKHAEIAAFAVKYEMNNLYLAAMYSQSTNGVMNGLDYDPDTHTVTKTGPGFDKARSFELAAQYGINLANGAKITPSLGYAQGNARGETAPEGDAKYAFKYVEFGATYEFNKNMSTYVDYKLNRIKDMDDTVALGVVYKF